MTTYDHPVVARKIVQASPGKTPALVEVDLGGVLEFRNYAEDLLDFEIVFGESGSPNKTDKLTGSDSEPICIHMPDTELTFDYYIIYRKRGHHYSLGEGAYRAKSCPGCGGH